MKQYFFIDFDGVICDSRDECFAASRYAYDSYCGREEPVSIDLRLKDEFDALRPYIRDTNDFLYLNHWLEKEGKIRTQEQFDSCIPFFTEQNKENYRNLFYKMRDRILNETPEWWFTLNPLYPGMAAVLQKAAKNPFIHILSSKKPEYISIIFNRHRIEWPGNRIHFPDKLPKMVYLRHFIADLPGNGTEGTVKISFLDDQIDHFTVEENPSVEPMLASWGYVKREWLKQKKVRILSLAEGLNLISDSKFGAL